MSAHLGTRKTQNQPQETFTISQRISRLNAQIMHVYGAQSQHLSKLTSVIEAVVDKPLSDRGFPNHRKPENHEVPLLLHVQCCAFDVDGKSGSQNKAFGRRIARRSSTRKCEEFAWILFQQL